MSSIVIKSDDKIETLHIYYSEQVAVKLDQFSSCDVREYVSEKKNTASTHRIDFLAEI